jgi:serine/threonine protein kinase
MGDVAVDLAALAADLEGSGYKAVRPLARGGMGEVFAVEHLALGERRVMKLLRGEYAHDEELIQRLRAEAKLLMRLSHRHLVRVLDFGFTRSGRAYLVSELLDGEDLRARVKRTGPLDVDLALRLTSQVLAGLEVVHAAELVHRDLKPDNLFIARDGDAEVAKILDFGIAKILREETRREIGHVKPTADGVMMGTPQYISPEQIAARSVDFRTDIYGVGGTMTFMLTAEGPFPRSNVLEVLRAHTVEPAQPPSKKRPEVSPAVDALVLRALAKRAEDRFQTAADMRRAVEAVLAGEVASAPSEAPRAPASQALAAPASQAPGAPALPAAVAPSSPPQGGTGLLPRPIAPAAARKRRLVARTVDAGPIEESFEAAPAPASLSAARREPAPAAQGGLPRWILVAIAVAIVVIVGQLVLLLRGAGG